MVRETKKKSGGSNDFKVRPPPPNYCNQQPPTRTINTLQRRKAKVGKKAVAAANATDTKFSSKRISMADQSIMHDRSSNQPTAQRGRELAQLMVQTRHYAPKTRQEALEVSPRAHVRASTTLPFTPLPSPPPKLGP